VQHLFRRAVALLLLVLLSGLLIPAQPALAASFVVTNTSSSGAGSLHEAIRQANLSAGPHTITFNIPTGLRTGDRWVIPVPQENPLIVEGSNITIDGTSQPNAPANGKAIELAGPGGITGSSVLIITGNNNTIQGLAINNSNNYGIQVQGLSSGNITGNRILNNYIGTNYTGTAIVRNSRGGILVSSANNTTIDNNLVSGSGRLNNDAQITIAVDSPSTSNQMTGNVITNNKIGTNAAGTASLYGSTLPTSPVHGIVLGNNAVSTTVGPGNIISGNQTSHASLRAFGVRISGNYPSGLANSAINNVIKGNYIGTNAAGTGAVPNGGVSGGGGIRISTRGNHVIGGTSAADRNIISGNNVDNNVGILIDSHLNTDTCSSAPTIVGNYIGLNAAGTAALPNDFGIRIAPNPEIALGSVYGPCNITIGPNNVISGNNQDGIRVVGTEDAPDTRQPQNITIKGNFIGTNPAGTSAIANKGNGIMFNSGTINNTIGGASAADRNVISGNSTNGIVLETYSGYAQNESNSPNGHAINNNYIGVNANGTGGLGNAVNGVLLQAGAHSNTLLNNTISGHNGATSYGVLIQNSRTTNNVLFNNGIGTNAAKTGGIANRTGLSIIDGATGNQIGTIANSSNSISFNTTNGVAITNANGNLIQKVIANSNGGHGIVITGGTGNLITSSTTQSNTQNGISLASNGNNNRAAPTGLGISGSNFIGTAAGCANCTIEVFTNEDANQNGEGNKFLSAATTTTNASGNFSIPLPITGCDPYLVVTVRDGSNNTSAFSNALGPVEACQPSSPNITLTAASPASNTVDPGTVVNYVHRLTNTGTAAGTFTVSLSSPQGWAVLVPSTTSYNLNPGQFVDITVRVTVPASAAAGSSEASVITAQVTGRTPVSRTDTTTVKQNYAFDFTPPAQSANVELGASHDFVHTITNNGNGSDTFTLSTQGTVPSGITVSFPDCTNCTVAAGQSRTVRVRVTVGSTTASVYAATIRATSQGGIFKEVIDTVQIRQIAVPQLTPSELSGSGKPGTTVTYQHTLKNIGGASGIFTPTVTLPANATTDGWTASVSPTGPLTLATNAEQVLTISVNIPAYTTGRTTTYSDTLVVATVKAEASTPGEANSRNETTATDRTTVRLAPALTLTQDETTTAAPGQVLRITHTIANTGNGSERFNFTSTVPSGWTARVLDSNDLPITSITLARGAQSDVTFEVTLASGLAAGSTHTASLRATAASDNTVQDSVDDTITIVAAAVPALDASQTKSTDPGVAVSFTHTLSNVGNAAAGFNVTVDVPAGWSAAVIAPSPIPSLAAGSNTTFVVTVTPPSNALASSEQIKINVTADDSNAATTSVIDTVVVEQKAELVLTPDHTSSVDPNTVVTYTHTVTNSGNFTDTVSLSVGASQPWALVLGTSQVTLAPNASQTFTVSLTIPPGIPAGTVNTTLVTATSSLPPANAVATNTATVRAVPGLQITPPLQQLSGESGSPVTFTFKLLNTGSMPLEPTLSAAPPSGWTAVALPNPVATIQPGQEVDIQVVVTAPDGTPRNTEADTILTATSDQPHPDTGTAPSASATARLRVGPAYQFEIAPDRALSGQPGELVVYNHTITNTGMQTDTIVLSVQGLLGWQATVVPSSVVLAPGQSLPLTVSVRVPSTAEADYVEKTVVTGRSTFDNSVQESATDTTSVVRVARVNISPRDSQIGNPGDVLIFSHRVFNLGNSTDRFTLSYDAPAGWQVQLSQTQTPNLVPGFSVPVQVQVTVPANFEPNSRVQITIRATSEFDSQVHDEVIDTINGPFAPAEEPEQPYRTYLPLVVKDE
jgi:uncharacterized membrane protein